MPRSETKESISYNGNSIHFIDCEEYKKITNYRET